MMSGEICKVIVEISYKFCVFLTFPAHCILSKKQIKLINYFNYAANFMVFTNSVCLFATAKTLDISLFLIIFNVLILLFPS